MLRPLADEDFNRNIVRGLLRRRALDVATTEQAGLNGRSDPEVLAWAAAESRVLITHDATTMIAHARDRIAAGAPVSGVIVVRQRAPIGPVIEDLLLMVEVMDARDFLSEPIVFVPL